MSEILLFYEDMDAWYAEYVPEKQALSINLAQAKTDTDRIEHTATSFPEVNTDMIFVSRALRYLRYAIENTVGKGKGLYNSNLLEDGIFMAAEFPEAEITWEKIVAAWADADTTGRLMTTLSIDFMRKEVWDESVSSFMLRSGKANE